MQLKIVAFAVLVATFAGFRSAAPSEPPPADATVEAMVVDAGHSSVIFRVKHMNLAWFYGRFNRISGEINLDEKNAAGSNVSFEIDADSIDTNSEGRDRHLKNPDFFDVKQFPKITFKSKTCTKKAEEWELAGDLTLRGVTKPLTVMAKQSGAIDDPRMGRKIGYEVTFTVNRSEFGMTYGVEKKALGDEILIMMGIETAMKK